MSIYRRAAAALNALRAEPATRLRRPPSAPVGPTGPRTREVVTDLRRTKRRRASPLPVDRTRWLRADIERAEHDANSGQLRRAAQIAEWCKGDLVVGGLLSTRCSVPRLPRIWRGDADARAWLEGAGEEPGCFDAIYPPGELEEIAIDHLTLGVGVGIHVHPEGAPHPRLVRLDNQFLRYIAHEDRYQYQGYAQTYDVEPGDVWVLHTNGEQDPWRRGIWAGLGYDQVSEDGAGLHRDGFIWKFGNPFIVATAPTGAADEQKASYWRAVLNWTMGFAGITPGYKVEAVQPRAEGREVFNDAEARVERRAMMRIAGQIVTSLGGPGFANAEVFAQIASFLVARTGQDLAATLNAQGLPAVLRWKFGGDRRLLLAYDTTPPQARRAEADAIKAAADAVASMRQAGFTPDMAELQARFRLPGWHDGLEAARKVFGGLDEAQRAAFVAEVLQTHGAPPGDVHDAP